MDFEWDENKRRANVAKHAIDFVDAVAAFSDPRCFIYRSPQERPEPRWVAVGASQSTLMAVVFTRRGDRVRIISARRARRSERSQYG